MEQEKRARSTANNNRKKSLLIITTIVLILLFIIGTTLAFLGDRADTLNIIRIGRFKPTQDSVQVILTEDTFAKQIDANREAFGESGGHYTKNDKGELTEGLLAHMLPGQAIHKDPTITNVGEEEVYLRMQVLDEHSNDAFENPFYTEDLGLTPADHWIKRGDFYYYSLGKVQTGPGSALDPEDTLSVFSYVDEDKKTSMVIPLAWEYSDIKDKDINLTVHVQAIQYRYFEPNLAWENPWQYTDGQPVDLFL